MQYIVVISSRLSSFLLCSLKNSFFWFLCRFKTSFLFLKVCLLVSALSFFSLFFALFLIICVVVCVSFLSFFALSCVVRKKLSIETRARVVAKKREISFGDESREEETKECGPE